MIVSSKGRYALIVMIDLARHADEGYIPLREIAERQKISEKYLEAILRELVKSKLLDGIRGKGGGYKLVRSPEEYTAWDIISVAEEGISTVACLEMNGEVHCQMQPPAIPCLCGRISARPSRSFSQSTPWRSLLSCDVLP